MPTLLQSLFDDEEPRPLSVSELNAQVKSDIERRFRSVWVEGEIVNFNESSSGHWYFTLNDGVSQIRVVVYKGTNYRIRFQPFDGLQVRLRGRVTIYEPRGDYQLLAESLEPVGEGALRIAYDQIKTKLQGEGLFDEALKRKLPAFPRKIGVVTSPTGAAFFDILHVLSRRARSVSVILIPTLVQGEAAGEQISKAIHAANSFNELVHENDRIDVLIVGRGGGSAEDLWAFNEELVARTIGASKIPIISAVGHEIDFTIADLIADVRAPTPSAAAEIVAQREEDIQSHLERQLIDLVRAMEYKVSAAQSNLQSLEVSPIFAKFPVSVRDLKNYVDELEEQVQKGMYERSVRANERLRALIGKLSPIGLAAKVNANSTRLAVLNQRQNSAGREIIAAGNKALNMKMATLDALSPLSVLNRGFSITQNEAGEILRDAGRSAIGDKLKIRLANGKLDASVTRVEVKKAK